jgi:hypothetical protein
MADNTTSFLAWRKKKTLLLKVSFVLILAGFALGYTGGVSDSTPLTACAFVLWGAAGTISFLIKS